LWQTSDYSKKPDCGKNPNYGLILHVAKSGLWPIMVGTNPDGDSVWLGTKSFYCPILIFAKPFITCNK
jgi:hypothetical protein